MHSRTVSFITFTIDVGNRWDTTVVDKDTRISSLEGITAECPAATTMGDIGPEWLFYTANLGAGCAFGVDFAIRDDTTTFDNIAVSAGGWTTVYDFEL
jgi:hypothetical protein